MPLDVTLLTKPNCMQCSMTTRQLDAANIDYLTLDITQNANALEWALDHDFRAAPIVVVGDMSSDDFDAWSGFRPDKISNLLARVSQ